MTSRPRDEADVHPGAAVDEALRALPKTELHLHLEGAIDAATAVDLARRNGVDVPLLDDPAAARADERVDRSERRATTSLVATSVVRRADFQRVAYECLERCSTAGVRHVELFFSPQDHLARGVPYAKALEGITSGLRDAEIDLGITCLLVPSMVGEPSRGDAVEFVDMVQAVRTDDVVGIGLDVDEIGAPPDRFADAFDLAESYGLHRTSHLGDAGPAGHVRVGIDLLGLERVDHGYSVVDDDELIAECAVSRIPFTVCPTATRRRPTSGDLADPRHAIRVMFERGLTMTVNSDDPALLGIDLADEYATMHHTMDFSFDDLAELALNGLDAAWIDEGTRRRWRDEWSADVTRLRELLVR